MEETDQERARKIHLEELKERGMNPYPYKFELTYCIKKIREEAKSLTENKTLIKTAGRVMRKRGHGKVTFVDLEDKEGKIQLYFKKGNTQPDYEIIECLDIGDWLGVEGFLFRTHRGELTILVKRWQILSKSLLPLPEKWHGIKDKELKYRKRWLDLIMNPSSREVFKRRAKIISQIRNLLNSKGFLEVETPILQPIYGGGFAEPFKSYYKAMGCDFYLRISDELYLKQLIVGGLEKVYEFGKDFRNEGMDRLHNPEFTQLEIYQAYADYEDMMKLVEEIFEVIAEKSVIKYQNNEIKITPPWRRIKFMDALEEHLGKELEGKSLEELIAIGREQGIEEIGKEFYRGKVLESLFDHIVQPKLLQPTFIVDYPKDVSPLAKEKRGNPTLVERFEVFIGGIEIGNAFSELNDPMEQLKRFEEQNRFREEGDFLTQPLDENFIEALKYGMPPTGGVGLGIDRIVMLLTNSYSIKEVIAFPPMRRV